jgi:hypothetical protein
VQGLGRRLAAEGLHLLVEDVLGLWLRQRVPAGHGICESVLSRRRPARRGDGRRLGQLVSGAQDVYCMP